MNRSPVWAVPDGSEVLERVVDKCDILVVKTAVRTKFRFVLNRLAFDEVAYGQGRRPQPFDRCVREERDVPTVVYNFINYLFLQLTI